MDTDTISLLSCFNSKSTKKGRLLYYSQCSQCTSRDERLGLERRRGGEEKGIAYFRSPCHVGVVVARTDGRTKKKRKGGGIVNKRGRFSFFLLLTLQQKHQIQNLFLDSKRSFSVWFFMLDVRFFVKNKQKNKRYTKLKGCTQQTQIKC